MQSDHVKLSGLLCSGCGLEYGGVAKLLNTYESLIVSALDLAYAVQIQLICVNVM